MGPLVRIVAEPEPAPEAPGPAPDVPAAAPPAAGSGLLEAIDRDGMVRQAWRIERWPVTIGRALDNDVVLTDPHVAARHATLELVPRADPAEAPANLLVSAGATRNGLSVGRDRLAGGATRSYADTGRDLDLHIGRTALRLRLPGHALAPEQPLAPMMAREIGWLPTSGLALAALSLLLFSTYIDTDPDGLGRAIGTSLLGMLMAAALWCGFWALLSKIFARQSSFGWHVRVFVVASLAGVVLGALPALLAFAFSWPWATDFAFVAVYATIAAAIYFHLLAVEPGRERLMRAVALTGFAIGVALQVWFNVQRTGRPGEELYMNHLFPPQLRVARPVSVDRFVEGLAPMQAVLDRQAKEQTGTDADSRGAGDDEE
ncbi:MAG: FHA domain-containing protein [Caldimonas sp.]